MRHLVLATLSTVALAAHLASCSGPEEGGSAAMSATAADTESASGSTSGAASTSGASDGSDGTSTTGDSSGGPGTSGGSASSSGEELSSSTSGGSACGDGVCEGGESCEGCPADCGACSPGACDAPGGRACGGEGIGGGDLETLYVCEGGSWVVDHPCGGPCEAMPAGVPDRCVSDLKVPAALVDSLDVVPYVEDQCGPGAYASWPYEALECTYSSGGLKATVTVANPTPARAAAWIVDASTFIPTLWALKASAPKRYKEGVIAIGAAMLGQSSRIFPLHGGIIEDLGGGAEIYPFDRGITEGCGGGCYCRINSLHRTEWCGYQQFLGVMTYDECIAEIGDAGLTPAWGARCLQNHVDAWESTKNDHFRAKAWKVNTAVKATCPTYDACTPDEVVAAVKAAL